LAGWPGVKHGGVLRGEEGLFDRVGDQELSGRRRGHVAAGEDIHPAGLWAQRTIIRPAPGCGFDADLLVSMKPQRGRSDDPA
jgi:hypothetical protein